MQKIHIKNFGPVKDVELEINDVLLFIGPQASGKSTISKSIFFFKSLHEDLMKFIFDCLYNLVLSEDITRDSTLIKQKFLNYWGQTIKFSDTFLKYEYKDKVWISLEFDEIGHGIIKFSPTFIEEYKVILKMTHDSVAKLRSYKGIYLANTDLLQIDSERKIQLNTISEHVHKLFNDDKDTLFIPAGRSVINTISDKYNSPLADRSDFLLWNFIHRVENIRHLFMKKNLSDMIIVKTLLSESKLNTQVAYLAERYIKRVLKGTYVFDEIDGDKIYYSDNKFTPLPSSSSGQQEVVWILMLCFLILLQNQPTFIVIEEPEAHLYPDAQQQLVNLITLLANQQGNQVIITTHSPYILTSLNNLLYAYKIGAERNEDVAKVIDRRLWLDIKRVSAYYIENGTIRSIIDTDLNMIKSEEIDSASRIINKEFDLLYELAENTNAL